MRIVILDIARCGAIIMLLLAHIAQAIENPLGVFFGIKGFYFVSLGGIAVTIFLIISGLAIELQYGSKEIKYHLFILKRIRRIYPIYYLSLLVGIAVLLFNPDTLTKILSGLGLIDILLSITGFYSFAGQWGGPFVDTSWFIGLIMSLYILYPPISKVFRKSPHRTILILFLISALSRIIMGKYGYTLFRPLDWFPLCRIFEFSLGIYLANILRPSTLDSIKVAYFLSASFRVLSELSFPLFLVHFPLLSLLLYFLASGVNFLLSIFLYLFISFFISWIFLLIDKGIPRSILLRKADAT